MSCSSPVFVAFALLVCTTTIATGETREKRDIMFPGYNEPANFYHHHHHNHQHRLPSRRPGQTTPSPREENVLRSSIPEQMMEYLNEVTSMDDFLKYVRRNISQDFSVVNRFGADDDNVEKKAISTFKFANCLPEEQTVRLDIPDQNPLNIYMPQCVRVKRCGGCCPNSIHTCMATQVETLNYKVMGVQYRSGMHFDENEAKIVPVEVHNACKCMCKNSQKDCGPNQRFEKHRCECACNNKDDQKKCKLHHNDLMDWDPKNCMCVCRNMKNCSTGLVFNLRTCKCDTERVTRRTSESRRRRGDESAKLPSIAVRPIKQEN